MIYNDNSPDVAIKYFAIHIANYLLKINIYNNIKKFNNFIKASLYHIYNKLVVSQQPIKNKLSH